MEEKVGPEIFATRIEDVSFSHRAERGLVNDNIVTVADLVKRTELPPYKRGENFGPKSRQEVLDWMEENGLCFGMEIPSEVLAPPAPLPGETILGPPARPNVEPQVLDFRSGIAPQTNQRSPTFAENLTPTLAEACEMLFQALAKIGDPEWRFCGARAGTLLLGAVLEGHLLEVSPDDAIRIFSRLLQAYPYLHDREEIFRRAHVTLSVAHELYLAGERNKDKPA